MLFERGATAGQTVQFLTATGQLNLTLPDLFAGAIRDFGAKDQIDLLDTAVTGLQCGGGVLSLFNGKTPVVNLNLGDGYTKADFQLGSDSNGGTMLSFA